MPLTRSFTGFRPSARYDAIPWNRVRIEEAETEDGTYAVIDTLDLDPPLDADPTEPVARNFTTTNASFESAWYRLAFLDASDNEDPVPDSIHYPIAEGYPTTPELISESQVDELTGLTSEQQDALRAASIVAIESYCCQQFVDFPGETVNVESGGGYELYLPKRLRTLTSVTPYGGDPLEEAALGVDPEGDRIVFHKNVVGTGYYEQALYEVSGGDYATYFPLGTLQITGDWGWESAPDAVATALRYDMEEQALADQNALASTVHAVRRLGLSNIGQGSLRAELVTPPLVSPRVEAILGDYLWHGEAGKLV